MIYHCFDAETRISLGPVDAPVDTVPWAATAPPYAGEHKVARAIPHESSDPALCAWEIVEDWRGVTVYDAVTGAPRAIEQLGPLPAGVQIDPPPPRIVRMEQARLALLKSGLLALADSAIAAMTGKAGEAARIYWEYSPVVDRLSPLVEQVAQVLGLSEADVGELFSAASKL